MRDALTIEKQHRGFWLFKEKIVELRAKLPSFENADKTSIQFGQSSDTVVLRALAERLLSELMEQLPFLRESVSGLKQIHLENLRALDGVNSGNSQVLYRLSGEISEMNDRVPEAHDTDANSNIEISKSIPIDYSISTRFDSCSGRTVIHSVVPVLSNGLREHAPDISAMMVIRNPAFKFSSMMLGFEKYQFKSRLAKWCHLPTVDYKLELQLAASQVRASAEANGDESIGSILLRGSFSKDADPEFLRELERLIISVCDFFDLGTEMHKKVKEILT